MAADAARRSRSGALAGPGHETALSKREPSPSPTASFPSSGTTHSPERPPQEVDDPAVLEIETPAFER
jgi:hypothetical protein